MTEKELVSRIQNGEIDINNQSLFFSELIKGLLLRLDDDISIRSKFIPHIILHTGDDTMYLSFKGNDHSIEPGEISNEDYIYNIIPRCVVTPGSIDIDGSQVSAPNIRGTFTYENADEFYTLTAEMRRIPLKLTCELKYYVDSYRDMLELVQQTITKLAFIRTFSIVYLGQKIMCSYSIPQSLSEEHTMDIDGTTADNKARTMSLSIEVETNIPVFAPRTCIPNTYITKISQNTTINGYDRMTNTNSMEQ